MRTVTPGDGLGTERAAASGLKVALNRARPHPHQTPPPDVH